MPPASSAGCRGRRRATAAGRRGRIRRYDLAPVGPSETAVTLTYDWSAVPQALREHISFPPFGPEHLTDSLQHLQHLAELAGSPEAGRA